MSSVSGQCDARFHDIRDVFVRNLASGVDVGASVAVVESGRLVVDLWGGYATADCTTPWESNTITNVYSTTKTMVALVGLMLIDRGQMAPDDRVAKFWPEFGVNGKQDITIANLMSHTSGLPAWDPPFTLTDLYDWNTATSNLASAAPWWEPGTAFGYHMLTYGHLIGEVVRRTTGKSLGRYFAEEIAKPLGLDFHIGLHPSEFGRVAPVFLGDGPRMDVSMFAKNSFFMRTHMAPFIGGPETTATAEWRSAEIAAANGHGNARSVAMVQSAMSNDGVVLGKRLLGADTIALAATQQVVGVDLVLQIPIRFGLGYALASPHYPIHAKENVLYWSGFGGSRIVNLPNRGITFAYVMNKLRPGAILGDPRGDELFLAMLNSVG